MLPNAKSTSHTMLITMAAVASPTPDPALFALPLPMKPSTRATIAVTPQIPRIESMKAQITIGGVLPGIVCDGITFSVGTEPVAPELASPGGGVAVGAGISCSGGGGAIACRV